MRLHIIRHADPDYQNNTITPAGHLEARALAERLKSYGVDRIYSSPLGRAVDTMRYTADLLGLAPNIEEWTREVDQELWLSETPWGPIAAWDVPGEVIRESEESYGLDTWGQAVYLGESGEGFREAWAEMGKASDAFLARHGYERVGGRYRSVKPNREKIAVFCHGGLAQCWLAHLLQFPLPLLWSGIWIAPSSVTTILFEERSPEWATPRCIEWGDTSHLYAGGLPIRPRGIKANFY